MWPNWLYINPMDLKESLSLNVKLLILKISQPLEFSFVSVDYIIDFLLGAV